MTNEQSPLLGVLGKLAEASSKRQDKNERLVKPAEQVLTDTAIQWFWEPTAPMKSVVATVTRETGEYGIRINGVLCPLDQVAELAKVLQSAVEWQTLWKMFIADYLLQNNSQPSELEAATDPRQC